MWRASQRVWKKEETQPCVAPTHGSFRALIDESQWQKLPPAVQARFERELAPGDSAAFVGAVATTRMSLYGRVWSQLARLIGAPLPLKCLEHTAAAVIVTQDEGADTQVWTRVYHESGLLPQVICSTKRFAGPTGLEECVGAGIGMALVTSVEDRALVFRSSRYFWRVGRFQLHIPDWLTPGRIAVIHREERVGRFSFTLIVTHPWFGETIHQVAFFRNAC